MPIAQQLHQIKSSQAKHVPMRRCVLCRKPKLQTELIRFYKTDMGSWELDRYHLAKTNVIAPEATLAKPEGRGMWVCFDTSCHNPKKIAYNFKKQAEEIETHLKRYATSTTEPCIPHITGENTSTGTDLNKTIENEKFQSGGMNV